MSQQAYKITNLIEIGEKTFNMDDLPLEKRESLARQLNRNALFAIGYRLKNTSEKGRIYEK